MRCIDRSAEHGAFAVMTIEGVAAVATVAITAVGELLGFLDSLTRIGRSLIYVCQIVPPDAVNERVLVTAGEAVPPARVREMYGEAERAFVTAARRYLNGGPPGLA